MFGKERIPILQDQIQNLRNKIQVVQSRVRGLVHHGKLSAGALNSHYSALLNENNDKLIAYLKLQPVEQIGGWQNEAFWQTWVPPILELEDDGTPPDVPRLIRIGEMIEARKIGSSPFRIPAFAPFLGENQTVVIRTKGSVYDLGLHLLQSLLVRTAILLPHQTRYTLLDPAGHGAAFPMRRHLPQVHESNGADVYRDLERVIQDIQRINETYLDASTPAFELVDPKVRINERFEFVFAADFPNRYDRRAIEALQSVGITGPRTGTYLFIHYNMDNELPRDLSMDSFKNVYYIDIPDTTTISSCSLVLEADRAPEPKVQEVIFEKLRNAKPPERKVDWTFVEPVDGWWQESASKIVRTPIGVSGASGSLDLWFGVDKEGRPCAHGMLGAMTGSGKSNLYHVLIMGLCVRYSPNELRLYLIDGKDGVEFPPYRDLPHAQVVSLNSSPQLSRSVLAELIAEKERRNRIFTDAKVKDFTGYREVGQPFGNLPRILLLVDEYQELFEDDKDGEASALLLQLAQQGRSTGIHMLLGSQGFGAVGMLNQAAIFGNVHLRIAMLLTKSSIEGLTEFGRKGKHLIANCDLPGKIVVNDRSGDDGGNKAGKVAYLTDRQHSELIDQLIDEATKEFEGSHALPRPIVFDGRAQPNLIENPYINYLLQQSSWQSPQAMEEFARRPIHQIGLDAIDWFMAEYPAVTWVGQEFNVHGQATLILRRRLAENILVVGANNAARYGMLASILTGFALNTNPSRAKFVILDRTIPGTDWSGLLEQVVECLLEPGQYEVTFAKENRDVEIVLDALIEKIEHRRGLKEEELIDEPAIYALMTELDRVDDLRRRPDSYSMVESPLGTKLQRILTEGPSLGVHTILSFAGVRPMSYVVDERRGLLNFRHRIGLQMSEDESLTLARSRKASQLQLEGPTPVCGLYIDVENDRTVRFKTYSIETPINFIEQLKQIGSRLAEWSRVNV